METRQQVVGDVSVFKVSGVYTHRDADALVTCPPWSSQFS